MNEEIRTQRMVTFYLCMIVAVMLLMLPLFFTSINALPGNGGGNDPWITSSPVTYHISDANPTGSSVSNDGLVLSMDMETLRAGKMKDFSGNSNDGLITGLTISDNGIRDKSVCNDAYNDSLFIPYNVGMHSSDTFTLSFWINPKTTSGSAGIIDTGFSWGEWGIYIGGGDFNFRIGNWFVWAVCPVKYDVWQSVSVVFNKPNLDFYLNNVKYSQVPNASIPDINIGFAISSLWLWQYGGYYPHAGSLGYMDELLLFSRALSQIEVHTLYNDSITKYGVQTGVPYVYQAVQNQTSIYPAWSVSSNAPNVSIDSLGKVMGYWEVWQNGTYWINVTVANVNGYAWQNYSVVVVEGAIIPATFQFTNDIIFGLLFYIICLAISLIGFRYGITILCIITLLVSLLPIVNMLNLFGSYAYILILFILPLALIPIATWRK